MDKHDKGFERVAPATKLLETRRFMYEVQEALDQEKDKFSRKEEEFRRKEEHLRAQDALLQNSLIKFTKFLQENETKRRRAETRVADEKSHISEKEKEIEHLKREMENLKVKKEKFEKMAKKATMFESFLDQAKGDMFNDLPDIVNRYRTLVKARDDLQSTKLSRDEQADNIRRELTEFRRRKMNDIMTADVRVATLQRQFEVYEKEKQILLLKTQSASDEGAELSVVLNKLLDSVDNLYARIQNERPNLKRRLDREDRERLKEEKEARDRKRHLSRLRPDAHAVPNPDAEHTQNSRIMNSLISKVTLRGSPTARSPSMDNLNTNYGFPPGSAPNGTTTGTSIVSGDDFVFRPGTAPVSGAGIENIGDIPKLDLSSAQEQARAPLSLQLADHVRAQTALSGDFMKHDILSSRIAQAVEVLLHISVDQKSSEEIDAANKEAAGAYDADDVKRERARELQQIASRSQEGMRRLSVVQSSMCDFRDIIFTLKEYQHIEKLLGTSILTPVGGVMQNDHLQLLHPLVRQSQMFRFVSQNLQNSISLSRFQQQQPHPVLTQIQHDTFLALGINGGNGKTHRPLTTAALQSVPFNNGGANGLNSSQNASNSGNIQKEQLKNNPSNSNNNISQNGDSVERRAVTAPSRSRGLKTPQHPNVPASSGKAYSPIRGVQSANRLRRHSLAGSDSSNNGVGVNFKSRSHISDDTGTLRGEEKDNGEVRIYTYAELKDYQRRHQHQTDFLQNINNSARSGVVSASLVSE